LIFQLDNPNQTQDGELMSMDENISFREEEIIDAIGLTDLDK
jgi:hypothetical protein